MQWCALETFKMWYSEVQGEFSAFYATHQEPPNADEFLAIFDTPLNPILDDDLVHPMPHP